jgi:hypothetical protein
MGTRKATRNRRLRNRNVLQVKLRTQGQRLARVRLVFWAMLVALGTVVGLFLVWRGGEWALREMVFENHSFALRTVQIEGEEFIPRLEIMRWSGVREGENLLGLDLARVKRDLELVPLIRSAAVERVPPNTLRIRVTEREPLARVLAPQAATSGVDVRIVSYYLDKDGYLFGWNSAESWGHSFASLGMRLPTVRGIPGSELRPGRAVGLKSVRSALEWAAEFKSSPMAGLVDVRSIDVSLPEVLQVQTSAGSLITFSHGRTEEQFRRWWHVHEWGRKQGRIIQSLDLSITNNSPVTFLDAVGPVESSTAAPVVPAPRKKRHV